MRTFLAVMKKECLRIINDRRLFFSAVILPGLLIFLMYTLMGNFMANAFAVDEDHVYQVHAVNLPQSAEMLLSIPELNIDITHVPYTETVAIRQQIENRDAELLLVFPENFDERVAVFDPTTATELAPNIQIWANTANASSNEVRHIVTEILNAYHHALTHRFSINAPSDVAPDGVYDLATDADMFAVLLGMLVPMMFLIFIFQGAMTIAPESISGEKERGTLGALLVTPASRRTMALGKVFGISLFSLLGAVSSIIGMAVSMPSMMGISFGELANFYTIGDVLLLLLVAASTTLVFTSLLAVLSAYAKTVKEATAYATPLMLIAFAAGLASTILGGVPTEFFYYLIPVFNSALSLSSIVAFEVNATNMIITALSNVAFAAICTGVLGWIFNSEKIVFS